MSIKKIYGIYRNMALPAKASFWFIIMSVLQKGIQFLVTPIYTRFLTTEEYGFYNVFVTWQSIFGIISTLNLSAGVFNNGMMKYENDRSAFISSMQGLANTCTVIVFSFLFLFFRQFSSFMHLDLPILIGMFISFLLYPSFEYWSQKNRYSYNYVPLIIWTVLYAVISSGLSLFFIFVLPESKYAIIFGTIVTQVIWGGIFYTKNIVEGRKFYHKEYWRYAFKFNIALIPHYLSFIVLGQADRIMIDLYCGTDVVAIYSLSYTVSLMLSIVASAISATIAPWTYQKMKKKDTASIRKVSKVVLIMLATIVLICVLIAPELVMFLGTDEYLEAMWIIPPVMLSCFYTMVYSLFANIEFFYEKSFYVMIASVIAAMSNVILNAIFIPFFGFIAAGYTTLVSYIVLAVIHYILMKKCLDKNEKKGIYDLKFIITLCIGISVFSIILSITYNYIIIRYILVFAIMVACLKKKKRIIDLLQLLCFKG